MRAPLQYVYRVVEVVKVTDGDTYWMRVDVGFRQTNLVEIRLDGWDCPEVHKGSAFEREQGNEARTFAQTWFRVAAPLDLWVQTERDPDDFGRWLGKVWVTAPGSAELLDDLGNYLASHCLATPWPTRWREVYDKTKS